jgi:RimJ/RimL family protein N-acetyltransferase
MTSTSTTIRIQTSRLTLRSLGVAEAKLLMQAGGTPGDVEVGSGYPVARTGQAARRVAERWAEADGLGMFLIVRRLDNQVIGDLSAERGPRRPETIWVYVEISPPAQRQGYGGEAVRAISRWAGRLPSVGTVRAEISPGGEAVLRTFAAAGYRQTPVKRGEVWEWNG